VLPNFRSVLESKLRDNEESSCKSGSLSVRWAARLGVFRTHRRFLFLTLIKKSAG
jgi:hypothetical protein